MTSAVNVCVVGHGMMGTWHSEALRDHPGCVLYTLVGKSVEAARSFAASYGYCRVTDDFAAVADPAVDAVILTSPSEDHAWMALATIAAGKPVLVEIPLAMTLTACERLVEAAEAKGVPLAVCHPMRFRVCRDALVARLRAGEERLLQVQGRFYIHRLVNIGATGLKREWTDNILWHHAAHLVDFGLFLAGGGDPEAVRIRRVESVMPSASAATKIPMELAIAVETEDGAAILASGSYHARERIYETMAVTDRDSYRVDEIAAAMTTGAGTETIEPERLNAWRVARDFVDSVRAGWPPFVTGRSVLPAMRVLETVQAQWDARYGTGDLPGRPREQFHGEIR